MFFCRLNRTGPINVNMRFQTLYYSILFIHILLHKVPHRSTYKSFCSNFLAFSKVGATHVSAKLQLKFFSEQKWMHCSPLQMLRSYLIKGERPSLSSCLFYEPLSRYIACVCKCVCKGDC